MARKQQYVEVHSKRVNLLQIVLGLFLIAICIGLLGDASPIQSFGVFILTWVGGTTIGVVGFFLVVGGFAGEPIVVRHYIKTEVVKRG